MKTDQQSYGFGSSAYDRDIMLNRCVHEVAEECAPNGGRVRFVWQHGGGRFHGLLEYSLEVIREGNN